MACAVLTGDPIQAAPAVVNAQALQPPPNQVEWAVDTAVHGKPRSPCIRQGGYRSSPVVHDAWWSA
ncbi:hypothetical protein [Streptomyces mirabilis]|uniref:hypothetical protein n=1 Tax=Streptomyces mirabilis TaxID=68239 RepID=UPI00367E51A8